MSSTRLARLLFQGGSPLPLPSPRSTIFWTLRSKRPTQGRNRPEQYRPHDLVTPLLFLPENLLALHRVGICPVCWVLSISMITSAGRPVSLLSPRPVESWLVPEQCLQEVAIHLLMMTTTILRRPLLPTL